MLKLGNLWIELWEASDIVLLVLTTALVSNLTLGIIFCMRRLLEKGLSRKQADCLLKALLVYLLLVMPLSAMVFLYKNTYHQVGHYEGSDGIDTRWVIGTESISHFTPHGNHWIFIFLLSVWTTGFLICILKYTIANKRLIKKLKAVSSPCQEPGILHVKRELMREMGLREPICIWENDLLISPFVSGCFRPEIFLSQSTVSKGQIRWILKHELVHCKGRDYQYRRMLAWLCALYWFTPFPRIWRDYCVDINEMACDETVLRNRTKKERLSYANVLVKMKSQNGFAGEAVSLTGYTESQLERRLESMLKVKTEIRKRAMALWVLLLAAACPLTTFAASRGMSEAQDSVVGLMIEKVEIEMDPGPGTNLTEETDMPGRIEMRTGRTQVQPRGATYVDEVVNGKEVVSLGRMTILADSKVQVWVSGDKTTDFFQVGYVDARGKRNYVSSSDGTINHTFTFSQVGTYEWFLEGLKTGRMHVAGSITVRE